MKKSLLTASLLATGLAASGIAQAVVVASTTLNVSATVAVDCTVATTPVNFGNMTTTQTTATGDVSVTCTTGTPYVITLDAGLNFVGNSVRHMKSTTDGVSLARYILTSDAGLTAQWGDASYAGTYFLAGGVADTSNGTAQPHPVYGQAVAANASGASAPAGNYSDTVTVTVNY